VPDVAALLLGGRDGELTAFEDEIDPFARGSVRDKVALVSTCAELNFSRLACTSL
jgi:hypothetical protein